MFCEFQEYIHHPRFWHKKKRKLPMLVSDFAACLTDRVKHSIENHILARYVGHAIEHTIQCFKTMFFYIIDAQ
uniref:Uncharacterized protein n=1 Tax=Sciurus vulgaris TaxID=55149 RepID=A0A8D2DHG4_SCIVU